MPTPSKIKLHRQSKSLELHFSAEVFELAAEYLRVMSPSAEVRGHGPGQAQLQYGKCHVAITDIEPQGNYAIKLIFDDGHNSGIYTWNYLYELGKNQTQNWDDYLEKLHKGEKTRDPEVSIVTLKT